MLFGAHRRPVLRYGDASVALACQQVTRRKLLNTLKDGLWIGDISKSQVLAYRAPIELAREVAQCDKSAQLRREYEALGCGPVVERLDTKAITGEHQSLATDVPDREREHPAELVDQTLMLFLVEVRERLGITLAR